MTKSIETCFSDFIKMDKVHRNQHIINQKSVDYLLELYNSIEDSEFEDVDKHHYGTRVYQRIYTLVSNNGKR